MAMIEMGVEDCFDFVAHHVPYMKTFKTSWRIAGSTLGLVNPSQFEQQLRSELPFIPRSAVLEIFRAVQAKHSRESSSSANDNSNADVAALASAWANAAVPPNVVSFQTADAIPAPKQSNIMGGVPPPNSASGSAYVGSHGGGNQAPSHTFNESGGFQTQQPALFTTPSRSKKFAFGRNATTPLTLQPNQLFYSPPFQISGPEPSSHPPPIGELPRHQSLTVEPLRHQSGSEPLRHVQHVEERSSQQHQLVEPLRHQSGSEPLRHVQHVEERSSQQHQLVEPLRHQAGLEPLRHVQQIGELPRHQASILPSPLQQVHVDHAGKVYMPWEIEALRRPFKPADPDMMPGFKRLSISSIIEKAKQIRLANKESGAPPTHFDKVIYPQMKHFSVDDYLATRQAYYVAVRKSIPSCLFTDFKFCMSDSCRTAAMRKFSLDDEQWIDIDDAKLQSWFGMHFGPKNKSDAINRLDKIRFPSHRDDTDSQADFVDKLNDCAYEFEMSINDIANNHRTWCADPTSLMSGELTLKEVMEIWRRKFAKQENSVVYSVQMKDCRTYMERDKEALFVDIVLKLSNHFATIDEDVRNGKVAYSTRPSKSKPSSTASRNFGSLSGGNSGGGANQHSRGDSLPHRGDVDSLGKRQQRPSHGSTPSAKRVATAPRVTQGKDRCVCCGSTTNHWGLGQSVCPVKNTKYDMNKNGHVWKDSDQEKSIIIPKAEYDVIVKNNPAMFKKQADAKDTWKKQKHQARVSALVAGEELSASDEDAVDSDDADALADELHGGSDNDSAVNEELCDVSALRVTSSGSDVLAEENTPQFFGVSKFIDDAGAEHFAKTLLDPGATVNIISPAFRDLCAVETRQVNVKFFQGDREQCSAKELSRCRFALKHNISGFINHVEWFTVADMGYDVLLGRRFCRDNGFTRFDELLVPWINDATTSPHGAVSSIRMSPEAEAPLNSFQVIFQFARASAPLGEARYKRKPKSLRCVMPSESLVNKIGSSVFSSANPLSNLLEVDSASVDGVQKKLLRFALLCENGISQFIEDWFVIDDSLPDGHVLISKNVVSTLDVEQTGRRFRVPSHLQSSTKQVADSSDARASDRSIRSEARSRAETAYVLSLRAAQQNNRRRTPSVPNAIQPIITEDGTAIARFSATASISRLALPVHLDDTAAHNIIHESVLKAAVDPTITVFSSKVVAGIKLVLLEFSLSCVTRKGSNERLMEWFRVEPHGAGRVVIRGLFNDHRLHESDLLAAQYFKRANNEVAIFHRDKAPPRRESMQSECPSDDLESLSFLRASFRNVQDSNPTFASYHPVQHFKIHRDPSKSPFPFETNRQHANSLVNASCPENLNALRHAARQAQLASIIARKRSKLSSMEQRLYKSGLVVNADNGLPCSHLSLCFEDALDDFADDELHAKCAALSADDPASSLDAAQPISQWVGDAAFVAGSYVTIAGAVRQPELNGVRVRLYEKTSDKMIWKVRMLGKNDGIKRCHEKFMRIIPNHEQARTRPHSSNAGFLDVAIDETGQPTGDLPQLAHRQFGAEYSAALTARINTLKLLYPHVFTKDVSEPCAFEEMDIKLIPNAVLPSKSRYYRNTPKMKEEVRRQIQEQLDWNAIRKAETAHCSDILLVKRPHMPGQWRFVINFQKLNDATVPEQLIMPDPVSQHSRLAGNKIFGAFDLSSYFRQLRLKESCQYLTGFASDMGTFVHTRVPMGIRNAPSFAQRVLQTALSNDPIIGPLGIKNYFDDVPFGAKTEDEFIHVMTAMLDFCAKWKLKINPDKSVFGVRSITHVGFVVNEQGVSIDPERTRDIAELASPKSIRKVQSTLGILNYVRNFVPNFSLKAKCLTDKLSAQPAAFNRKRPAQTADTAAAVRPAPTVAPFTWSPQDEADFQQLKRAVLEAPLLAQLDYTKQIYVRCDASRFGSGAVLFQYDDQGRELVVCYASRKFLPAETRWSTFQQEASTVVWALERFMEFTQGYHVIVECDHRNISFVKRSAMPQLARWRMRLQDHDFSIRFLQGCLNLVSDGLSRIHADDVEVTLADALPECSLLYAKPSETVDYVEIAALACAAYKLRSVPQGEAIDADPLSDDDADFSLSESDSEASMSDAETEETVPRFGTRGELLHPDGSVISREEVQPSFVAGPVLVADDEISAVHNDLVGHKGVYVTLQRLLRNGRSWGSRSQMIKDVDNFLAGCPTCQKMRKRKSKCIVDRRTISGSPFAEISVDILKLPRPDARGNKYCVAIVDNFSRWTSLTAVANKSAFDAARAIVNFIGNFGTPLRLRSDGGGEFVNGVIVGLTRMMGVGQHVVQPYTPTANGIVERANRAILENLRELVFCERLKFHSHHQWGDLLPLVQRTLNASIHLPLGTSPSRILFGDNLDLDRAILTRIPPNSVFDIDNYVDVLSANQRVIIEKADELQALACDRIVKKCINHQKVLKNGRWVLPPVKPLKVDDWVLAKPQPDYPLHKLAPRWLGPFRILEIADDSDLVTVYDTVSLKSRSFLKRQLESFNIAQVTNVMGLTSVAEKDNFEFPVECIMGHALINEHGVGSNPVQLHRDFKRGNRSKSSFQFLVKWTGYEEPTWITFKDARRLVQFPGYVSVFAGLNML
jgi:hypothetical protein